MIFTQTTGQGSEGGHPGGHPDTGQKLTVWGKVLNQPTSLFSTEDLDLDPGKLSVSGRREGRLHLQSR